MTTSFIFISAAMILAVIGLLTPTLLRRHRVAAEGRQRYNVQVARDRLAELQAEHANGDLSDEEFEQAKKDLEIALAQDLTVPSQDQEIDDNGRAGALTLALLLILVPAIVAITYTETGTPAALGISGPGKAPAEQKAVAGHDRMPPIGELVKKLEDHLKKDPNNVDGWFLLGRTYMKLERYDDAVRAFRRLNALQPDNSTAQISLADALSMQNKGQISDTALELLHQVEKREPRNVTALWLLGNAAAQRGQDRQALDYWARAYPLLADEPAMQAELGNSIRQIEARSGLSAKIKIPKPLPSIMGGAPAMAQDAGPAAQPGAANGPGIEVEVALDPELMAKASPNDLVFIYAKAVSGPPMPLAVARKHVSDLPIKVKLTDAMAMLPQMRLSKFPRVKVGARVSKSGRPIPGPGDLQSPEVETASQGGDKPIQLLIDHQRN